MPLTIGLFGTGRLGSAIRACATSQDDVSVTWTVGRQGADTRMERPPVDVAIEVSHADAVPERVRWAGSTGTPLVIGTTGWDTSIVRGATSASSVPLLLAPNLSLGVALVRRLAVVLGSFAAAQTSEVDLAVTETHHRGKRDSPSGTAISLREALATGAGRAIEQVQTTSLRLGSVVGNHEIVSSSALETITLRHVAHDRELFAAGALAAAQWLHTRPAGVYTLDDLAEDRLQSLFTVRPR